ncbi:MotA/TolQ/ExbB proton channel family protein [Azonexus hydrophilus]|uniref:MotA/TolQ/ExbB proton channel family protein n=1 Tax=Azonexus hydrophilus TaxID=418702 RepID=UPI00248F69FC|nr:MotA/TolQ/ExbB proton channel family protein [Azonexus hydrophilus]
MEQSVVVEGLGFAHFLGHLDGVGRVVLGLLLLMSVASWYLIVTRWLGNFLAQRQAEAFLKRFWQGGSRSELAACLHAEKIDNAFARLALDAVDAAEEAARGEDSLKTAGGLAEYLTRTLNNAIDQEAAAAEHGLTVLASAGSAAPYIGLFGTVWGIYHALVQIGLSGQGTLDKVAGPVGEALIMTALGLAVAIPAVLAYNAFSRRNRLWLARLEGFAHDLYVLLTVRNDGAGRGA